MSNKIEKTPKRVPEIKGVLRSHMIEVPSIIREASGIRVLEKE